MLQTAPKHIKKGTKDDKGGIRNVVSRFAVRFRNLVVFFRREKVAAAPNRPECSKLTE